MGVVRTLAESNKEPIQSLTNSQTGTVTAGPFSVGEEREILFLLNITGVTGTTPTLNVFVDTIDTTNNTTYQIAQIGATNITATGKSIMTIGVGAGGTNGTNTAFGDTIQVRFVITGTFTANQGFTGTLTAIAK